MRNLIRGTLLPWAVAARMPGIAIVMTIGGLASFGLPATSGFVAEFLSFYGMWLSSPVLALLAVGGIVLTAIYVLRVVQKIFLGPFREEAYQDLPDARATEWVAVTSMAVLLIVLGVYPRPMVDLIDSGTRALPAVSKSVQVPDPIARTAVAGNGMSPEPPDPRHMAYSRSKRGRKNDDSGLSAAVRLYIADSACACGNPYRCISQNRKAGFLGWLTAAGALAALALDWAGPEARPWNGIVVFDSFSRGFDTVFLVTLALVAAGSAAIESRMKFVGEYYGLLIFSTIGLMLMASSGGLLALYIGIELSTISLFALVGFSKRERKSLRRRSNYSFRVRLPQR